MGATTLLATITAVEEALTTSTGKPRAIGASYLYKLDNWPDRPATTLSMLARKQPLAYVAIRQIRPIDVIQELTDKATYNITVGIELCYYLGHEGRAVELKAVEARAADDFHRLRSALCYPANLLQTSAAVVTGLVSGCLRSEGSGWQSKPDIPNHILRALAAFAATVYLDFPV